MIVIGIDPGISKQNEGGIACIQDGVLEWCELMPTLKVGKNKQVMDVRQVRHLIEHKNVHVFIEKQQTMPNQGSASGGKTMWGEGALIGICEGLAVYYETVKPKQWQGVMFSGMPNGDTKTASIVVAQRMYPSVDFRRSPKSRKAHHGMTDAALIATYGWRKLSGGGSNDG